jgi:hypothetical protein
LKYFQILIISIIAMSQIGFSQTKVLNGFVATLGGGASFPINDEHFKDNYDYGFNFVITGGYKINKTYIIRGGVLYNRFPYAQIGTGSGALNIAGIIAEGQAGMFSPKQKYHPYGVAGIGLYFTSSNVTINGVEISTTENDIGINAGGGIVFDLSKNIGVFAELQYNYLFSKGGATGFIPFKAGFTLMP